MQSKGQYTLVCVCLVVCATTTTILMVSMILTVYSEYKVTEDFTGTKCDILEKEEFDVQQCRVCPSQGSCYSSRFPCVQLRANYTNHDGQQTEGILYASTATMHNYPQCSRSICSRSENNNHRSVEVFVNRWYQKTEARCYYNTLNNRQVLTQIQFTQQEAMGSILIPACFTALMIILLTLNYCTHKKIRRRHRHRRSEHSESGSSQEHLHNVSTPDGIALVVLPPSYNEIDCEANSPGEVNQAIACDALGNPIGPPPSYTESANETTEVT